MTWHLAVRIVATLDLLAVEIIVLVVALRRLRRGGFNTRNRDFERGVEYGLIFAKLSRGELPAEQTVHTAILGMVTRAAEAKGVVVSVGERRWCEPGDCPVHSHTRGEESCEITLTAAEAS